MFKTFYNEKKKLQAAPKTKELDQSHVATLCQVQAYNLTLRSRLVIVTLNHTLSWNYHLYCSLASDPAPVMKSMAYINWEVCGI